MSAESDTNVATALTRAQRATVEVLVDQRLKGSGVFVSRDGDVVVGAHIFESPGARFEVVSPLGGRLPAKLVAFDKGHDLALLRVESTGHVASFPALPLADEIPPMGTRVHLLSAALRNPTLALPGVVAQPEPVFNEIAESHGYVENFYVAGVTPALTSGGPWVNAAGEIVGIQLGRLNDDGNLPSGIAMVAPAQAAAELLGHGRNASTPGIGGWVWELWTVGERDFAAAPDGTEGLIVTWVREGGPLARAGVQKLDIVTHCDGKPVRRRPELLRRVRSKRPGQTVRLTLWDAEVQEQKEATVELQDLEEYWLAWAAVREREGETSPAPQPGPRP